MDNFKIFSMSFSKIYPLYIQKVKKKGWTKEGMDEVIFWLTGYFINSRRKENKREGI